MDKCVASVTGHERRPSAKSGSIPAATLHLWIGETDEAANLVERYHYSHRWPSNVQFVMTAHESGGLFDNKGRTVAAVVYSIPGTRWSVPMLELSRLVRVDDAIPPLSWLIAQSLRRIKRDRLADLVVSFADVQHGHHGGVYRASNWRHHGIRPASVEGVIVNGTFIPGRSANSRFGTRSPEKLREIGIDAQAKWDQGKHLYWYPITPSGLDAANAVGLQSIGWD